MADASSKKRKRDANANANGTHSANKRSATEATITVRHLEADGLCPAIVSSKTIVVPSLSFKAYAKGESDKVHPKSHSIILRSSEHVRLDYTSIEDTTSAHYIGLFDPTTDSLGITPAHYTQLKAVLRTDESTASPKKTVAEQRRELGEAFGTKKAKKAIASRTVNAITNGGTDGKTAELQGAILDGVEAGEAPDEREELKKSLAAKPLPMPNLDAGTVEEVYPIDLLIPAHDMRNLDVKEWRKKAKAQENVQFYNRFPAHRFSEIGQSDNTTKLKALMYMALLLRFNDTATGKIKKLPKKDVLNEKLKDYSSSLIDSVRRRFADESGGALPKFHLEKLHTTICALSLYIDDWRTDMSDVRDDLRIDAKTVAQYFAELACRNRAMTDKERTDEDMSKAEAATHKIAYLRLPLEFPKPRMMRRN